MHFFSRTVFRRKNKQTFQAIVPMLKFEDSCWKAYLSCPLRSSERNLYKTQTFAHYSRKRKNLPTLQSIIITYLNQLCIFRQKGNFLLRFCFKRKNYCKIISITQLSKLLPTYFKLLTYLYNTIITQESYTLTKVTQIVSRKGLTICYLLDQGSTY